jgi:hypothetical protein
MSIVVDPLGLASCDVGAGAWIVSHVDDDDDVQGTVGLVVAATV